MIDKLSKLNLCEDDFKPISVRPSTIVCRDEWGSHSFDERIKPLIKQLDLKIVDIGLNEEGIAVTFDTKESATLFKMFFHETEYA